MSYKNYKEFKNKFKDYLLFEKQNNYYYVYEKDSYIINNFFHIKFNVLHNIKRVYIPESNIELILDGIRNKSISYLIFYKNNIISSSQFSNNNYESILRIISENELVKRKLILLISKKLDSLGFYQVESISDYIDDNY